MLIKSRTNREVPPGKLPADVGCLVMNITSVAFLANYLKTGMPLVSKRITVSGPAIASPKNVIVPIGNTNFRSDRFLRRICASPKKTFGRPDDGACHYRRSTSGFKAKQCHPRFWRKGCRPAEADRLYPVRTLRCRMPDESCPDHARKICRAERPRRAGSLRRHGLWRNAAPVAFNRPAGRRLVQSHSSWKRPFEGCGSKKERMSGIVWIN